MPVKVTYQQFHAVKEATYEEGSRVLRGSDGELEVRGSNNKLIALHREGAWDFAEVVPIDAKEPHIETPALYLNIANLASSLENIDTDYVDTNDLAQDLRRLLSESAPEDGIKVQDA